MIGVTRKRNRSRKLNDLLKITKLVSGNAAIIMIVRCSIFTTDLSSCQIRAPVTEVKTDCTLRSSRAAVGLSTPHLVGASQKKWMLSAPKSGASSSGSPSPSLSINPLAFHTVPPSKYLCSSMLGGFPLVKGTFTSSLSTLGSCLRYNAGGLACSTYSAWLRCHCLLNASQNKPTLPLAWCLYLCSDNYLCH